MGFRFCRELRIMLQSILHSLHSLVWTTVVLVLFFYMFGVLLTTGTAEYLEETNLWRSESTQELRKHFGSLDRAVLSMFMSMSGGVDWADLLHALRDLPW